MLVDSCSRVFATQVNERALVKLPSYVAKVENERSSAAVHGKIARIGYETHDTPQWYMRKQAH